MSPSTGEYQSHFECELDAGPTVLAMCIPPGLNAMSNSTSLPWNQRRPTFIENIPLIPTDQTKAEPSFDRKEFTTELRSRDSAAEDRSLWFVGHGSYSTCKEKSE